MEQEQTNYYELLTSEDVTVLSKRIGCARQTLKKYLMEMNQEKTGLAKACSDYVVAITKEFLENKRQKLQNI